MNRNLSIIIVLAGSLMACDNSSYSTDDSGFKVSINTEQPQDVDYSPIPLTGNLNTAFLLIDGIYNTELMGPYDVFHHTKFPSDTIMNVFTVGRSTDTVVTFEGLKLIPDYDITNHPPIDVLVVASAVHNMDSDLQDTTLISWVKSVGGSAQLIISLCDGAFVLAQAGLLNTLHATTFPSDIDKFEQMFPEIKVERDVSFVHDGKAITSAGGVKSYDAAQYLVERLYGKQAAIDNGAGICIDWNLAEIKHIVY